MVNVLFRSDDDALAKPGVVRTIYDHAAGTGGMLSTAYDHLVAMNHSARPVLYGQRSTPLVCHVQVGHDHRGQDVDNIYFGDTLTDDGFAGKRFDYLLSNPPFGVEWKSQQKKVTDEHEQRGHAGRFGPGLPRVSDGSLLFLLHLISKMEPVKNSQGGSRLAMVLNGSPLCSPVGLGRGSNIRQWIIENDLLDAIIALPTDMFYNTGISTYIWVLDNNKPAQRRGKGAVDQRRRHVRQDAQIAGVQAQELRPADVRKSASSTTATATRPAPTSAGAVKVFKGEEFGYSTITVERPRRLRFTPPRDNIEAVLATRPSEKLKAAERDAVRTVSPA